MGQGVATAGRPPEALSGMGDLGRPLRVLMLTDRYPPYFTGGYEIACHAITETLRKRGHDVSVLASNYGLGGETRVEAHVRRELHRPQDSADLLELGRWEVADNRTLKRALLDREVVYAWSLAQLFASLHATLRRARRPVVYALHDLWIPDQLARAAALRTTWLRRGSGPLRSAGKALARAALKLRDPHWLAPLTSADVDLRHAVFCSRFRRDQHLRVGLPIGDARVIYNGLDLSLFRGGPKPVSPELRVLFVGRLVKEKGVHTLLEAVTRLLAEGVSIRLTIVGVPGYPPEYVRSLRQRVQGLGSAARLLDPLPHEDLPALYREHDVLAFPSIGEEGFPMTLIEAMACGTAVVSTVTGGSAEILEDGRNCLTFPAGDAEALAERLRRLATKPGLGRDLATQAQAEVRSRFDIHAIGDQTLAYLSQVVTG